MRRNNRDNRNHRKSNHISHDDTQKITNVLLKVVLILFVVFLIVVIFNVVKNWINYHNITEQYLETLSTVEENKDSAEDETQNTNEDVTFNLTAIGDVMCHNTQYMDAYNSDTGEYDFSYVFEDIEYYIKNSNITVANLETTFAGEERGYSNYPRFNSPDALAYNLKKLGVDVLSTAGNHSLDTGFDGLSRTIDVLDDADISHVGTYRTNGIAIPSDKPYCVNLIDEDLIKSDIESAKAQNADIIVASMHWGTEYSTVSNDTQNELADFLFQNGVNIILGTHPHVLQQMEKRTVTLEDGTTQDGFIIYSLGNFISGQNAENTRTSIILDLQITKHADDTVTIDNIDYIPIYMYRDTSLSTKRMKLLDIEKTIALYEDGTDTSIGEATYTLLKGELEKVSEILNP